MHKSDSDSDLAYNAAEFCSTKDAARLLGVSHRTVQLWVENGALQAWKTAGGHRRITVASVHKLVNERRGISAGAAAAPAAPAVKKLLLVDDDHTLLRLYELEIAGWNLPVTVVKAQDGFEALIRIGEQRPDILVSDLSMPGMDGFRMIRTLRADASSVNMAVIVVSGLDRTTIDSIGLPDDIPVFPKPVPFNQLRAAVEQALSGPADTI
ncbi:response regulator [Massilia jejuensis]|uniref:Response regulator n=1 Tax=Massilia jejuensis TaxID=648894 RepID=A0ABW0PCI4_9BURK